MKSDRACQQWRQAEVEGSGETLRGIANRPRGAGGRGFGRCRLGAWLTFLDHPFQRLATHVRVVGIGDSRLGVWMTLLDADLTD